MRNQWQWEMQFKYYDFMLFSDKAITLQWYCCEIQFALSIEFLCDELYVAHNVHWLNKIKLSASVDVKILSIRLDYQTDLLGTEAIPLNSLILSFHTPWSDSSTRKNLRDFPERRFVLIALNFFFLSPFLLVSTFTKEMSDKKDRS